MKVNPQKPPGIGKSFPVHTEKAGDAGSIGGAKEAPQGLNRQFKDRYVGDKPPTRNIPMDKYHLQGKKGGGGHAGLRMIFMFFGKDISEAMMSNLLKSSGDMFLSPSRMMKAAGEQGFKFASFNNGTLQEVKSFVNSDLPVMTLMRPEAGDAEMPVWMVVRGEQENVDLKAGTLEKLIIVNDPSQSEPKKMTEQEFGLRWADVSIRGKETPYNCFYVVVAPENMQLPKSRNDRSLKPIETLLKGESDKEYAQTLKENGKGFAALGLSISGGISSAAGKAAMKINDWVNALLKRAEEWTAKGQEYKESGGPVDYAKGAAFITGGAILTGLARTLSGTLILISGTAYGIASLFDYLGCSAQSMADRLAGA